MWTIQLYKWLDTLGYVNSKPTHEASKFNDDILSNLIKRLHEDDCHDNFGVRTQEDLLWAWIHLTEVCKYLPTSNDGVFVDVNKGIFKKQNHLFEIFFLIKTLFLIMHFTITQHIMYQQFSISNKQPPKVVWLVTGNKFNCNMSSWKTKY